METNAMAPYFENFLPQQFARWPLSDMECLSASFSFAIADVTDGEWLLRFREGRLADVLRGGKGPRADFGYRMGEGAFWDLVSGRVEPQEIFLDGRAEVTGDMEQALKMGVLLAQFIREHPYQPSASDQTEVLSEN